MDAGELLAKKQLRTATVTLSLGDGGDVDVSLKALPRKQYRLLLEEHPHEDPKKGDWNPDTFPPALIAACAVDPEFTVEQAQQLWDEWETSDSTKLFLACFNLNERPELLSFTLPGSAKTSGSGQNSPTALPKESPTPTS